MSVEPKTAPVGIATGSLRHHLRRYRTYSRELGGGLFANVVDGEIVSIGVEPVGPVVVARSGRVEPTEADGERRRAVMALAWAAPLATAAIGGAAVAATLVRRHHSAA